jgi:uncharacterized membrane-anchored protein
MGSSQRKELEDRVKVIGSLLDTLRHRRNIIRRIKSRKDEDLAEINQRAERRMIDTSAALERLGRQAIGGLHFRVNRSRLYADIYMGMVPTLRSGIIETWWSYDQFAKRGVEPAMRFVQDVGARLEKLRSRLADSMESVQTSAIVNQTEATRDNTFQLELIANELNQLTMTTANILEQAQKVRVKLQRWSLFVAAMGAVIGFLGRTLLPGSN